MPNLIREDRYIFQFASEEHVLRVQELIWGSEAWPGRCRILLPASHQREARRFYGATQGEVVEQATEYIAGSRSPSSHLPPPPTGE
jgi:hypothetical protein